MRITADTNLWVRALTQDDPVQAALAQQSLSDAEVVAVTIPTLCELVWVLGSRFNLPRADIAVALRGIAAGDAVVLDRPAFEAGLAQLEAGGDFADGVIAWQGVVLGGDVFTSFDRKAVNAIKARGGAAQLLGQG